MFEKITDEVLRAEARALEEELAALRKRPRRFRSDAHEALDLSVKAARNRVDALLTSGVRQLAHSGGTAVSIPGLADAIALTDAAIVKRWRHLVDAEPAGDNAGSTFVTLDRAEYNAERSRVEGEIHARATELARRIEERRHAAAVAELGDVPRETVPTPASSRVERSSTGAEIEIHTFGEKEVETHA